MLKKLLAGWLVVLACLFVVALKLPAVAEVKRERHIDAPPTTVFTLLNDFNRFETWSLLHRRDPEARFQLSGVTQGVGAGVTWQGDERLVGSGSLKIRHSQPFREIVMDVTLVDQGAATSRFSLYPEQGGTRLDWRLIVETNETEGWFSRLMGRFFGLLLDPWIGPDMEESLAAIEQLAILSASARPEHGAVVIVEVESEPVLFVSGQTSQASDDISAALADAFGEVYAYLSGHDMDPAGAPLAITRAWDESGFRFEAAVPFRGAAPPADGRVRAGWSPGGTAARIVHRGAYADILQTYQKLSAYLASRGLQEGALSWERYPLEPGKNAGEETTIEVFVLLAPADPARQSNDPSGPGSTGSPEGPG